MMFRLLLISFSIAFLASCSRVSFQSLSQALSNEGQTNNSSSLSDGDKDNTNRSSGLSPVVDPKSGQQIFPTPVGTGDGSKPGNSSNGSSPMPVVPNPNGGNAAPYNSACNSAAVSEFNINSQITTSSFYNYSGKFLIRVNEQDISSNKSAFLVVSINNVLYVYNFKTSQFVDKSKITSFADYGLTLPTDECQYPYQIFEFKNADLTAFGGSVIYAGYGVGGTADLAVNDMMSFKDSRHPTGRYLELFKVPEQPASVNFINIGYEDTQLDGTANIFVRSSDYNKNGYYFLAANSSDQLIWFLYTGTMWVKYDGNNFASVGGMQKLKNQSINFTADVTNSQLAGFKLYAGYAVGENIAQAFNAFVANSQNSRNTVPYILQANPSLLKNALNFSINANTSGAVSNYSINTMIKIADAHLDQAGYVFGVVQHLSDYYVLDVEQKRFVKWDGVLAQFPVARNLISQTNFMTFATNLDVTALGGAKLYIGYGVGSSPSKAVNEMLASTRWREIATIPAQAFTGSIIIPAYNKTSTAIVDLDFRIFPDYKDYEKPGKYYVILSSPDGSVYAIYTGSLASAVNAGGFTDYTFSGVSWQGYTEAQSDSLYTYSAASLKNFRTKFSIRGVDLANYSGYKLYVGYGKSVKDMLVNKTFSAESVIP